MPDGALDEVADAFQEEGSQSGSDDEQDAEPRTTPTPRHGLATVCSSLFEVAALWLKSTAHLESWPQEAYRSSTHSRLRRIQWRSCSAFIAPLCSTLRNSTFR